ncbi:MAG: hypothetical protein MRK01_05335 [Candidatus Scalindua sp.]|nr:hypothetical protein [Candidatus Scalindua sp.]
MIPFYPRKIWDTEFTNVLGERLKREVVKKAQSRQSAAPDTKDGYFFTCADPFNRFGFPMPLSARDR